MSKQKGKAPANSEDKSFEQALEELEALVEKLEDGEVPLEESVKSFEQGMKLLKLCRTRLETAETTIKKLVEKEEGFELIDSPMEDESEDWT